MISYEKSLELIEFQKQQIEDLQSENKRLRDESANASEALMTSNEQNSELCQQYSDAVEALSVLGVVEDELEE